MPTLLADAEYVNQTNSIFIPKSKYVYDDVIQLKEMVEMSVNDIGTNIIQLSNPGWNTITIKNIGDNQIHWVGFYAYNYLEWYEMLKK